ncbi:MAG TPA: glycosyltransferase [Anaerolineae bacterium]|nr:glycosyltransferase [Anaerolineae bacterium]HQH37602.1 glycosyltransferase [Anaerolineae bacterium]
MMLPSDPKRVLILTADAGFGHRKAATAIADALREVYTDACVVEIANPLSDKRVPAFLRDSQTDYDKLVRVMPDLYRFGYETSDTASISRVIEGALVMMLFNVLSDLVRQHRPDVVVTTYPLYQSPLAAIYGLYRNHVPLLTVVTDLATVHRVWFQRTCDMLIVPTEAVRQLALDYHIPACKLKVVGIPVHPDFVHRQGDKMSCRATLGWRSDLITVLIVGSKRVSNLRDLLRVLNHAGLPVQLAMVTGGDEALYNDLSDVEWHVAAHLYRLVKEMPLMMHAADCVISKAGGLIVSESLACGLPMILVNVIPGQETGNVEYVVNHGAGEWAKDPIGVLEILYHWLEREGALLAEKARHAQCLGRPQAAYDIADLIWEAASSTPGNSA